MGMLIHNRHSVNRNMTKAQSLGVEPIVENVEEPKVQIEEPKEVVTEEPEKKKPGRKPKAES